MISMPARAFFTVAILLVGGALILAGCNLPWRSPATPTLNLTEVYRTLAAMVTSPPATPTGATPVVDNPTTQTPTQALAQVSATPRPAQISSSTLSTQALPCDQAAPGFPIDVTIPDDTPLAPGEAFTKIWRLQNAGSCTWTMYYSAAFFYGDRMDAPSSVPFSQAVPPGATVEIAIEMIAPLTPGTYQGNWKLSNAEGILFGIGPNGDAPFWVRINVSEILPGTPTITPTYTPLPSASPTPTATPPVQASDTLTLLPLDLVNLDSLVIEAPGADLGYQTGTNSYHFITPMSPTLLGVYGNLEPGLPDCQTASMSSAPIAVESLSTGTYLCYRTDEGAFGRARLVALDAASFAMTLELLTWEQP